MEELFKIFKPITANKINESSSYMEIEPCDALKPYIRCFWGSSRPYKNIEANSNKSGKNLVIPDCCMDIIFDIDYNNNSVGNIFCSINDFSFYTEEVTKPSLISTFGIRFNFWAVHLFTDNALPKVCNEFEPVDKYFGKLRNDIENIVTCYSKIEERIFFVEKLFLRALYKKTIVKDNLLNGIYYILKTKGTASISEVSQYTSISSRQLERIFREYIGITPKKCTGLVRYQNVWRDLVYSQGVIVNDIVHNYGYSDQAHMINDFKKYHGSTPMDAIRKYKY